ncbi:hypothetical protein ACOBQJ_15165 [Pelotomaculum propionicicum]|uniref:hypothetical protein n=1 Tax=Pelotomaculum propionicicum TaxID=258475 RepID=UPI003B793264
MDEKWLLEQAAAEHFVAALNKLYATSYRVIEHSDKPDVIIRDLASGDTIGIEVTHLFYNGDEAKELLGKSDESNSRPDNDIVVIELIEKLNDLLEQKAQKARGYNHNHKLSLLVRVASPVFGTDDFDRFEHYIRVPISDYRHIWLLFFNAKSEKWDVIRTLKQVVF